MIIVHASWYRLRPLCWERMAPFPIIIFGPRLRERGQMDRWRVQWPSPISFQLVAGWNICSSIIFQQQESGIRSTICNSFSTMPLIFFARYSYSTLETNLTTSLIFLPLILQLHDIDKCTFLVELHLQRPYIPRGSNLNTWEVSTISPSLSIYVCVL